MTKSTTFDNGTVPAPGGKHNLLKPKRRRVILHGLRYEGNVSYRFVDFHDRDYVMSAPVGATQEQALAPAEPAGLYVDHYEEETE